MEAAVIILAGGKSSRMGKNKALLKMNGKTVIEQIVAELMKVSDNMLIVTNTFSDYEFLGLPMVEDKWKGMGPLAGIHAGLLATTAERNLIVACDMPFVSAKLGSVLLEELDHYDAVIPEVDGRLHPLFAAYRKGVKDEVNRSLEKGELRIRSIFQHLHVKIMDENEFKKHRFQLEDMNLFNMNYPAEYEQAKKMLK